LRGRIAEHIVGQEILGASNRFLEERCFWMREAKNSQANTAIRFWNNPERKDLIVLPGGKKFTLFNLPFYYAGFLEPFLEARMQDP
jgi:hypothetical protein